VDALKKEMQPYRGCFIVLGVILLIALFGGVTQLTIPYLGDWSAVAGFAATGLGILMWIGLARGARWAKIAAGIPLSIAGLGVSGFILYDFGTSLIKGQSLLRTPAVGAAAYGQSVFIILAIGIAMLGGGLYLTGLWKPK
jgi:hypothetical protein